MKGRIPDSLEHAITVIRAELGDKECERATGKSASLILKASDPDDNYMLGVDLALALDKAYLEKTGDAPPVFCVFARELSIDTIQQPRTDGNLIALALLLQRDLGKCSEDIRRATAKLSEPCTPLSFNECIKIMEDLGAIEKAAAQGKALLRKKIQLTGADNGKTQGDRR